MFPLPGMYPLFTPEKGGTQVLWRKLSWPWERCRDDSASRNGVPGSIGPWEGWEHCKTTPFRRKRDLWKREVTGMICVLSSAGEKRPPVFSKYFLMGGVIGYLLASETGIKSGFLVVNQVSMSFSNQPQNVGTVGWVLFTASKNHSGWADRGNFQESPWWSRQNVPPSLH